MTLGGLQSPEGLKPPFSKEAERSLVGQMLAQPKVVGEVVSTLLEPQHFYLPQFKALYHEITQAYYADDPMDPITIGEAVAKTLAKTLAIPEDEVVPKVQELALGRKQAPYAEARDHAKVIKTHADYRALLEIAAQIQIEVEREMQSPTEIAGLVSQGSMKIATSQLLTSDLVAFDDLGRNFVREQRKLMEARATGVELGAYFGLSFIDHYTRGLRPSELFFLAGDPGVGKSSVAWRAATMFAERQMKKPKERRIGTLILSLEMAEEPSSTRIAQSLTGIDGGKLREGRTEQSDLDLVVAEWRKRPGLPLIFNFTSNMRCSELRAVVVEAIRRHNVGFVVIDHFKYVDMDGRWRSAIEEDGAKARFLKQDIATQLNVAVMCLAHTTKTMDAEDRRPRLSQLRGSQEIAAHADFVAFVYKPYANAKQADIDAGTVSRTDAELIVAKNRHGIEGKSEFYFDASRMVIH
jgi:replicative DNA helicase